MRRSAGLAAAAVLAAFVPAGPATAAAKPTHVAIVIAGKGVACVAWKSGITGDAILNKVATVKYRPSDHLITQIDGTPSNNRADDTHYWSYWHNTGSGWKYSTTGASAYQPRAGTVEGWHFINGSDHATPPPRRSYGSICHDTAVVAPPRTPPTTPTTPTTPHSSHPPAPATSVPRATPTAAARAGAPTAARSTANPALSASRGVTRHRRPPAHATRRDQPTGAHPPGSVVRVRSTALPTLPVRTARKASESGVGSAVPTVLGAVLVLVLGGAALLATRRRRRG